jgi:hypothetical protein
MGLLHEEVSDQSGAANFSPRCNKDLVEDLVFSYRRDLF